MLNNVIFIVIACTSFLLSMPLVENLEIDKFMGRWYVISLVPNWIESGNTDSYDDYTLNPDGTIDISYHALNNGEKKNIRQRGHVDPENPARWEIQFVEPWVPFYKAPYEVIILDSSYQYMVVGYPGNDYGWIMSRSTSMDEGLYSKLLKELTDRFGYEEGVFEKVIHKFSDTK
ncbi:MAG: hypothetical protein CBD58_03880 [bacterium TMED198]|nr:MAG: hypothetical protein CBD58_03880 [bacterium TMED198]|tara:strand:+ start:2172 stop:2693 length:522 start_codon:yes stop_codon:yes gene_type:complete